MAAAISRKRLTLREALHYPSSISSPRDVLDYAYGDTVTVRTRLLDEDDEEDDKRSFTRCFTLRRPSASAAAAAAAAAKGKTRPGSILFRRLSTFPPSKHKLLQSWSFKKATSAKQLVSKVSPLSESRNSKGWRNFSFKELETATRFFNPENLIGKGGYSDVYKGVLSTGRVVAIKRLVRGDEEQFTSFLTELGVLGHVCHPNTASLIGFGIEGGLFLVFEFFPYGSLATMLHSSPAVMQWSTRFRVAVGTARGIHYLHTSCKRRIIHRDIKASNILLGPSFEPQITDFGLAKWLPSEWTHHTVPVEGTFGYLAPEYFMHGIVDEKTDVFAYGVLLLELITGLRPIDSFQKSLVMKVKPLLESGCVQQLVDSRLKRYDVSEMQRAISTARRCIRESAVRRPSMTEVLKLLVEGKSSEQCGALDDETSYSLHQKDMGRHAALVFGT